jgi:redox-sensing transcriptional repressor
MRGLIVHDISDLKEVVAEAGVHMAIIAVPAAVAQETCDLLIEAGIKAILSYAPINLVAPSGVQLRYSDPVVQLQQMTFYQET